MSAKLGTEMAAPSATRPIVHGHAGPPKSRSLRKLGRTTNSTNGHVERSPLVQTTTAKRIVVTTKKAMPSELDGGVRKKTNRLKVRVVPAAVTVRVPG